MYINYFGFREKPFNLTPDPRFFYDNPVTREAYAKLLYGVQERKGLLVLTGEVGTGKTTLLLRLMDQLGGKVRCAFLYYTHLPFDELLSFACEEFGLKLKENNRLEKIQGLNEFLIDRLREGGTAALLIDEAQNLSGETLDQLRLLSNLETASGKLLQIVLVGQPELLNKFDDPRLRQITQRIASWIQLERLTDSEVASFIRHRLYKAGYEGRRLFTSDAIKRIARLSQGIPRLINTICDSALLIAYASSQRQISAEMIREVADDLRLIRRLESGASRGHKTDWVLGNGPGEYFGSFRRPPEPRQPRQFAVAGITSLLALLIVGSVIGVNPVAIRDQMVHLGLKAEDALEWIRTHSNSLQKQVAGFTVSGEKIETVPGFPSPSGSSTLFAPPGPGRAREEELMSSGEAERQQRRPEADPKQDEEMTVSAKELEKNLADIQARSRQARRAKATTLGGRFESDQAELSPEGIRNLEPFIAYLEKYPFHQLLIEGHTDNVGGASYNRVLSRRRADAVRHYLIQSGIIPDRVVTRGFGAAYPVASNDTDAGRRQNRRVEIRILREGQEMAGSEQP